jgi:hypothetical protein
MDNPNPNGPADGTGIAATGQAPAAGTGTGQQAPTNGPAGNGQGSGQQQGPQNDGGQQAQQQAGQAPLGPDGQPLDPARLQRLVENLREENRQLKQRGDLGGNGGQQQAAGQQQGQGQAPAPQQNQQQPQQGQQQAGQAPAIDEATATQLRDQAAQLAVFKAAGRHSGDPIALTDSMSFMQQVRALDHTADDHESKVADLLKKHLEKNPHHRSGQAPGTSPRGGSDGTGRPGAPNRPQGLGGALSAHYASK